MNWNSFFNIGVIMVHYCVAFGCSERFSRGSNIKFHRFPLNQPRLLWKWVKAINRKNWKPTTHSRLCSKHFQDDCYITNRQLLKNDAVPTIFDVSKFEKKKAKYQITSQVSKKESEILDMDSYVPVLCGEHRESIDSANGLLQKYSDNEPIHVDAHAVLNNADTSWNVHGMKDKYPLITTPAYPPRPIMHDDSSPNTPMLSIEHDPSPDSPLISTVNEVPSSDHAATYMMYEDYSPNTPMLSIEHDPSPDYPLISTVNEVPSSDHTSTYMIHEDSLPEHPITSIVHDSSPNSPAMSILLDEDILSVNQARVPSKQSMPSWSPTVENLPPSTPELVSKPSTSSSHTSALLHQDFVAKSTTNRYTQTNTTQTPTKMMLRRKIKCLQSKLRRRDKKIQNFSDLIQELKRKTSISTDMESVLKDHFSGYPLELIMNEKKNSKKKHKSGIRYTELMKQFSITLHFYSPRAYRFLRNHFHLPHPNRITDWISSVDCKPGYLSEVFKFLEDKRADPKFSHLKECSLIFDSMSIRKQLSWDPKTKTYSGYVNLGGISASTSDTLAKEALVFQIVSYTKPFKCPLAYFFTNGISAEVISEMVKMCLTKLHEVGTCVRSITCDGTSVNTRALNFLGCNLVSTNISPSFNHPLDSSLNVYCMLDACHMIKLARNTLAESKVITSPDGDIKWSYIVKLQELQEIEELKFCNSLSKQHVYFHNKKMKVSLAAQTLSSSVANAIQFLDESGHPYFQNSFATVVFLKKIDKLFDILNSRNALGKGYKQPLNIDNLHYCQQFFEEMILYLKSLQINGIPILSHPRRTFVLGFLTCIQSVLGLASEFLLREENPLKYFLTYKLSQDHLELFFACIRARGGWNNNPNMQQFQSSLQSLLLKNHISATGSSNVDPDSTNVIAVKKFCKPKRSMKPITHSDQKEDSPTLENLFDCLESKSLTDYQRNILYYISGFIVRKIMKNLTCKECSELLLTRPSCEDYVTSHDHSYSKLNVTNHTAFVKKISSGGLICPSEQVFKIVEFCEKAFRSASRCSRVNQFLINEIIKNVATNFGSSHSISSAVELEDLHETVLIKKIVNIFFNLRTRAHARNVTNEAQGEKRGLRQKFTNLITFYNM